MLPLAWILESQAASWTGQHWVGCKKLTISPRKSPKWQFVHFYPMWVYELAGEICAQDSESSSSPKEKDLKAIPLIATIPAPGLVGGLWERRSPFRGPLSSLPAGQGES